MSKCFHTERVNYAKLHLFPVHVDSVFSFVVIRALNNSSVSLHEHEADSFIENAKALYNNDELGFTLEECYYYFAYEYIELLIP